MSPRLRWIPLLCSLALLALAACDRDPVAPLAPTAERTLPRLRHDGVAATALTRTPMVSAAWLQWSCALKADGTVVCWGQNGHAPAPPAGLTDAVQVSAGGNHVCALKADGTVVCWGAALSVPAGLSHVIQVSAGYAHACALKEDGTVVCWGAGTTVSTGYMEYGQSIVPADLTGVVQVSAGYAATCALLAAGSVVCWGSNAYHQLTVPADLGNVAKLDIGYYDVCALKTNATLRCWGSTLGGQLDVPADVIDVTQVDAGYFHSCALKSSGAVVCWGDNSYGQRNVPSWLTHALQVTAGGKGHSCALSADGSVACWGDNSEGALEVPAGLNLLAAPQAITFASAPPDPAYVGDSYAPTATGGGSGNPVTFSTLTPTTCSATNTPGTFLLAAAGTCTIAADQAGGGGSYSAAPQVTQNILVSKRPQTIAFTSTVPTTAYYGDSYTVAATSGGSGNPVVFSSLTLSVCTLSDATTVNFVGVGTCTVAANQAGNAAYLAAAQVTQDITVGRRPQPITITPFPPDPSILGGTYTISATGGSSGNPVVLSSLTPSVCALSITTLNLVSVGTCTIAASQDGNARYLAGQATRSISVIYNFGGSTGGGFTGPVSSSTLNAARAGQAVPVSFNLGGYQGLLVLAQDYPKSMAMACPSGDPPTNVVEASTATAGGSSLTYDPTTGLYTYVWKTDRAWAGTCRKFILKLADNSEHYATFQFVK